MKIYFAGSITGSRERRDIYAKLIQILSKHGEVLTEHVGSESLSALGENSISDLGIFERDMKWLKEADVVIAEVTVPSLGVGYELAQAEVMKKPVLCLYCPAPEKRLSAMIVGNSNLKVAEYQTESEAEGAIENFFKR